MKGSAFPVGNDRLTTICPSSASRPRMAGLCAQQPLIIVRQWRLSRRSAVARATWSALDFASLPGPIQRDSSRPMKMFPPADGKPELMIDRAHGGPSRNNNSLRSRAGIDATVATRNLRRCSARFALDLDPTATSGCPPPRSKPTRLPAFFAVVLATRLFAPTLKCGL